MKRLRKKYSAKKIRYYQCGEYGKATDENNYIARPHYHACIFNHDFDDRILWREREGIRIDTSECLDNIWFRGFTTVGDVTLESAAYTARYIMKKVNGKSQDEHYETTNETTGEIHNLEPEYNTMSRRPGIGRHWFDRYISDVYPKDSIHHKGVGQKPPKYYDSLYEIYSPEGFEKIKIDRKKQIELNKKDSTPKRLADRENVKLAQIKMLMRQL